MNILLCAATMKCLPALRVACAHAAAHSFQICSFQERHTRSDALQHIQRIAAEQRWPYHPWPALRGHFVDHCVRERVDAVVAMGWSYLLPVELNDVLPHGLIVFHDALLPRHRGFAPLATAILCGDRETGVSVLRGSAAIDAGDIILQRTMPLGEREKIADALVRMSEIYGEVFQDMLERLSRGPLVTVPQDERDATYSIWRAPQDAEIRWNDDSVQIDRLVRAAGDPYPGAFSWLEGERITVDDVTIEEDVRFSVRDPGKIWRIEGGKPLVVCGRGMLRIDAGRYDDGTDLIPCQRLRQKFQGRPR